MGESTRPISEIAEILQDLGQGKHNDGLFTGSEFVEEWGGTAPPMPDKEPESTLATIGGNINNAYVKVHNAYRRANDSDNPKTELFVGDLNIAVAQLKEAENKLSEIDMDLEGLQSEVEKLRVSLERHIEEKSDEDGELDLE